MTSHHPHRHQPDPRHLAHPGHHVAHSPVRHGRRLLAALGAVVLLGIAAVGITYRQQIESYLTHRKGGPTTTWSYLPHQPLPTVHLAVAGDVGDRGTRVDATGAAVDAIATVEPFDALLLLGDNEYPFGDPDGLDDTVFGPFSGVLDRGSELLAILGNHDVARPTEAEQLARLGMEGRWWSRRWDDVLLVGIDSTLIVSDDDADRAAAAEQLQFLDDTLAATSATWRIVAVHHPPYSAGYQGSNNDVRAVLEPVLVRHGVQLVLSGHDHDYQRSVPIDGVTYVVTGAGSGTRGTGEDDFTAVSWSVLSFVTLAVDAERLVVRAVTGDGEVFDEQVLLAG